MANLRRWWDTTFAVELLLLAVTAPILYFPSRFGTTEIAFAVGLLALGWVWRRLMIGVWYQRTPADWAIFFLFFVMLPVSIWASPGPLRAEYAWPKALVLIWNLHLFSVVVTHASRRRHLALLCLALFMGIALLFALIAPLGTNWLYKIPGAQAVLSRLPSMLGSLSREGGAGFHPNMVAGSLLYVLPLMMATTVVGFFQRRRNLIYWLLALSTLYCAGIFVLLQSRGGYIGLAVAVVAMIGVRYRWGRWMLLAGTIAVVVTLMFGAQNLLDLVADAPTMDAVGGTASLEGFRVELWTAAVYAINDFAFTGSGLGSIQDVLLLLYPVNISPSYYFGHVHNFWLQGAVDFGIPGLVAILALYLVAAVQLRRLWRPSEAPIVPGLAVGLFGCLIAQSIFSLTDAIPMGSTPNLLFWLLFGLIFAVQIQRDAV